PPALLRRGRREGRGGGERRALLRVADLSSPSGSLRRHRRSGSRRVAEGIFPSAAIVVRSPDGARSAKSGKKEVPHSAAGYVFSSAATFSFTCALSGSAARRIALAWKKSSKRNVESSGRSRISGAPRLSFSSTIVWLITWRVANKFSHGSGMPRGAIGPTV